MTEIKFGDEAVEIAAEAGFSAEYRWRPESWNVLSEPDKDSYRSVARAVLEALVASGWRREALTCQENAEPTRLGIFTDTHLHECAREQGHRSAVHRCACNTEWWEARQYVSAGTREGEGQKRDEEEA